MSLFSHVRQQSKVPTRVGSRSQRRDAICLGVLIELHQRLSGDWRAAEPQSQNGFGRIFDQMELVFIDC